MRLRLLAIGPEQQAAINRLVEFATTPENYYRPGSTCIPGDDPRYNLLLGEFYCVFSIAVLPEQTLRMLTISVDADAYPNATMGFLIAHEFGFTGLQSRPGKVPDDWIVDFDSEGSFRPYMLIAQPLPAAGS